VYNEAVSEHNAQVQAHIQATKEFLEVSKAKANQNKSNV
jgi:hypothetical protein